MKDPQVVKVLGENADAVLAVWKGNVIKDSTPGEQEQLTASDSPIGIDVDLFDITAGSAVTTISNATMTFDSGSQHWLIDLDTPAGNTIRSNLSDRHKYVAGISENSGSSSDMRDFVLEEFAIDNGGFEDVLMRMPFDIRKVPAVTGDLHMVWYDTDAHLGNLSFAQYKAPVYENGEGTTPATDASRVTHRGAIVDY